MKRNEFDPKSLRPLRLKKAARVTKDHSADFFNSPQLVANALAQAILDGDKEAFYEIICGYLAIVNKEELSRKSKVPIATIRRMAAGTNFTIENMLKVTKELRAKKSA